MSKDQRRFYWSLWKKACIAQGWTGLPKAEVDQHRHQSHYNALGYTVSSSAASNRELDKIFAEFRRLAGTAGLQDGLQLAAEGNNPDHPSIASTWKQTDNGYTKEARVFAQDWEPLLDQIDPGQDRRLRHALGAKIKALAQYVEHPDSYVLHIVAAQHKTDNLGHLSTKELWQLVYTLTARLNSLKSKQADQAAPEPELAPVSENEPF